MTDEWAEALRAAGDLHAKARLHLIGMMEAARAHGCSIRDIAREVGLSPNRVHQLTKEGR
jgi:hypothetical protein